MGKDPALHYGAYWEPYLFVLQVVVDDLGIEDVDEFEAELAAVNDAKSA